MKRLLTVFLIFVVAVSLVSCGAEESFLPEEMDPVFYYTSGAGAWYTAITLKSDGTFDGDFSDSEGDRVYAAEFSGKFEEIEQINDYSYSMMLSELHTERPAGEEWTENDVRFVASPPSGLEVGTEYILYTPDTPVSKLSEDFLIRYPGSIDKGNSEKLGCYAIRGVFADGFEFGFFNLPK
ncbi:MAG: hypothetical protein IJC50_03335 [Clostridia bacterium]|nr:hypothetical protein [Clostridia bacterium]